MSRRKKTSSRNIPAQQPTPTRPSSPSITPFQSNAPSRNVAAPPTTTQQPTLSRPNVTSTPSTPNRQNATSTPSTLNQPNATSIPSTPIRSNRTPLTPFKLSVSPEILDSIRRAERAEQRNAITSSTPPQPRTALRTTTTSSTPPRLNIRNNTPSASSKSSSQAPSQPSSRTSSRPSSQTLSQSSSLSPSIKLSDIIKRYPNVKIPKSHQTSSHEEAVTGKLICYLLYDNILYYIYVRICIIYDRYRKVKNGK